MCPLQYTGFTTDKEVIEYCCKYENGLAIVTRRPYPILKQQEQKHKKRTAKKQSMTIITEEEKEDGTKTLLDYSLS